MKMKIRIVCRAWKAVTPSPHSRPLSSSCPLTKRRPQVLSRGKRWQRCPVSGSDKAQSGPGPWGLPDPWLLELRFLKGEANQTSTDLFLKYYGLFPSVTIRHFQSSHLCPVQSCPWSNRVLQQSWKSSLAEPLAMSSTSHVFCLLVRPGLKLSEKGKDF